jgi:hypothetical protein
LDEAGWNTLSLTRVVEMRLKAKLASLQKPAQDAFFAGAPGPRMQQLKIKQETEQNSSNQLENILAFFDADETQASAQNTSPDIIKESSQFTKVPILPSPSQEQAIVSPKKSTEWSNDSFA